MRPLGTIVMSVAVMIAAGSALWPTSVPVLGEDYDCGPPLIRLAAQERSDDPNERELIERCEDRSIRPLLSSGIIVLAGVVGGIVLTVDERRREERERARRARARAAARAAAFAGVVPPPGGPRATAATGGPPGGAPVGGPPTGPRPPGGRQASS